MEPEVQAPVETPVAAPDPVESTSLADHESQFQVKTRASRAADAKAPAADRSLGTDGAPPADVDESAAGERDETGRFKPRHRAKSQQAGVADVPRIQELTRKLREAEAERDALRQPRVAAQPTQPAQQPRPAPAPVAETAPRLQSFIDALKPDEDYNAAVERHADAMGDWKLARWEKQQHQAAAERQFAQTFTQKIDAAKAKYPDFEAVALGKPSNIPAGSVVDRWVWEHRTGADVLYHFQKNDAELQNVLRMPALDQLEHLTLLAQRFPQPSRTQAVSTGSAAVSPVSSAPKPPNPVRSGAMRGSDEPPGDGSPLSAHETYYYAGQKRRRA